MAAGGDEGEDRRRDMGAWRVCCVRDCIDSGADVVGGECVGVHEYWMSNLAVKTKSSQSYLCGHLVSMALLLDNTPVCLSSSTYRLSPSAPGDSAWSRVELFMHAAEYACASRLRLEVSIRLNYLNFTVCMPGLVKRGHVGISSI
jgi:hypothetical protein